MHTRFAGDAAERSMARVTNSKLPVPLNAENADENRRSCAPELARPMLMPDPHGETEAAALCFLAGIYAFECLAQKDSGHGRHGPDGLVRSLGYPILRSVGDAEGPFQGQDLVLVGDDRLPASLGLFVPGGLLLA